jgi:BirA family biotin operon repressor/biotin-[acetyl-CoA-carboxylase] ligase
MKIFSYSCLNSTNDQANQLLADQTSLPFVVISRKQLAGKGRYGKRYFCPEGGLWFTLVDQFQNEIGKRYALIIALILTELLSDFNLKAQIKWPNDIIVNDKKVAGILAKIHADVIKIGIGINTNVNDFPRNLSDTSTSLLIEMSQKVDNQKLLNKFIEMYQYAIKQEVAIDQYRQQLIWIGSEVSLVTVAGKKIEGVFQGVTDQGFALVNQNIVYDGHLRLKKPQTPNK